MKKFHINPVTGTTGECSAGPGNCPFGGQEEHYSSEAEARQNFEVYMAAHTLPEPTVQEMIREELISDAERQWQEELQKSTLSPAERELAQTTRRNLKETAAFLGSQSIPEYDTAGDEIDLELDRIEWDNKVSIQDGVRALADLASEFELRGQELDMAGATGFNPWADAAGQLENQVEAAAALLAED